METFPEEGRPERVEAKGILAASAIAVLIQYDHTQNVCIVGLGDPPSHWHVPVIHESKQHRRFRSADPHIGDIC